MRSAPLSLAVSVLVTALVLASGVGASDRATASLRLDGVPFEPELAMTPARRSLGLMNRKRAPKDGMLFVFFDTAGKRVRKLSMTPCRNDPCAIYDPGRPYRFALELRAADTRPALRLGPVAALRRLARAAS